MVGRRISILSRHAASPNAAWPAWCSTAPGRARGSPFRNCMPVMIMRRSCRPYWISCRHSRYLDMERVGLMGSSASGYYAPRVAAFEKRIKACLILSALYDVVEGVFDVYPPIRTRLAEIIGADSLRRGETSFRGIYTETGIAGRIECPCRIVHGELRSDHPRLGSPPSL